MRNQRIVSMTYWKILNLLNIENPINLGFFFKDKYVNNCVEN